MKEKWVTDPNFFFLKSECLTMEDWVTDPGKNEGSRSDCPGKMKKEDKGSDPQDDKGRPGV